MRRLRSNRAFVSFDIENESRTRMLLEYITAERRIPGYGLLTDDTLGPFRFEPGITGLSFEFRNAPYFYMPSEAFTRSHMTVAQLSAYLVRRVGLKAEEGAAAAKILEKQLSNIRLITSRAFVTHGRAVLDIYRGYPLPLDDSPDAVRQALFASVEWLIRNQHESGKFLYYYDARIDSTVDFQHPNNPNYYNMLRHAGGAIALLRAYELSPNPRYMAAVKLSLEYLLSQTVVYMRDGMRARYVVDNRKAKLGGTGLGLVALMHYNRLSGDSSYLAPCVEMVCHLLSQIDENGEFIGYYIHPSFNDGRPLDTLSDDNKRKLFSFYYPGEALLGLALYERYAPIAASRQSEIRRTARRALNFLVHERPQKYPELFLPLPADAWLMQAIEEWWHSPAMRMPDYAQFVYADADRMIEHLYHRDNAPYPDYSGHFFYYYGQHAIPDGSRAEGLVAAYLLARKSGQSELAERYLKTCRHVAGALMQTYNSPESTYAAANPERAIGSFRFKLTRQWVRVDSIQHTACFYARLLPYI
jgi:hypothetical protein